MRRIAAGEPARVTEPAEHLRAIGAGRRSQLQFIG